jgi:hypothetical protein
MVVYNSQIPRIGGQTPDIISAHSVQLSPLHVDMDLKRFTGILWAFKEHHHNSGQEIEGTEICQGACIHWRHCKRQFSFNALHSAVDRLPPKPIAESQKGYTRTVHAHNSQAYLPPRVFARQCTLGA